MTSRRSLGVVAGIGELPVVAPSSSVLGSAARVADDAVRDAGISWDAVDGLITTASLAEPFPRQALALAEYLGIASQLTHASTVSMGGASSASAVVEASWALRSGECSTVVVVAVDHLRSGLGPSGSFDAYRRNRHPQYEQPYGLSNPAAYALVARAFCERYGISDEDRALVPVEIRKHAAANPAAQARDVLTVEDVLNSGMVADPLRRLECSLISDGGAALVLTTPDRADDLATKPCHLLGYGKAYTHDHVLQSSDLTGAGWGRSARRAFTMAGYGPTDIGVAQLYDCYSFAVLMALEDMDLVGRGDSVGFVRDGGIGPGGILPVATHGGLLSHAHPGNPGGVYHLTEAVRQIRRQAGVRQARDTDLVLCHGEGGVLSAHCTLILASDAAAS